MIWVSTPPRERRYGGLVAAVLAVIALLAAGGGYLYLNPRAAPAWLEPWLEPWLEGTPLAPRPARTTVYKWRNERGEWQITDHPPPGRIPYEELHYRGDVNVLPAPPGLEKDGD